MLLYYTLAIYNVMLLALGNLTSEQANPTEDTQDKIVWIINCTATHPNAQIHYTKIDMYIHTYSDA